MSNDDVRELLVGPPEQVAPRLLGGVLSANGVRVRVTEVEAYGGVGEDSASHAFRGQTARNRPMFDGPGTLYVYFTYGMHWCTNIVCGPAGVGTAVLIRAGEVIEGLELARSRARAGARDIDVARGPARLAKALALAAAASGTSVLDGIGPASFEFGGAVDERLIACGPRVGVSTEVARPWRFWVQDALTVSQYRPHPRAVVVRG